MLATLKRRLLALVLGCLALLPMLLALGLIGLGHGLLLLRRFSPRRAWRRWGRPAFASPAPARRAPVDPLTPRA